MPACRAARPLAALALLLGAAGCSRSTDPDGPRAAPASARAVRVADCEGPAASVPPGALAGLPPRGSFLTIDDRWADLARQVPGGFAGVFYDAGRPVLMLTDPARAAAAKEALAPHLAGFPVAGAEVRRARWDFAQLTDWYLYLMQRTPLWQGGGIALADKDEVQNRLFYGAVDAAARDRIAATLGALNLPCDLALVGVTGPVSTR